MLYCAQAGIFRHTYFETKFYNRCYLLSRSYICLKLNSMFPCSKEVLVKFFFPPTLISLYMGYITYTGIMTVTYN